MESKTYFVEGGISYFEKHYRENMDITYYITEYGKGCIFNGQAGYTKTHRQCKMVMMAESQFFSFTNKAIENVKHR